MADKPKVNARGFTDEEEADLAQAEQELDAAEPPANEGAPPADEAEAETPPEADAKQPIGDAKPGKPPAGFVPQQAIHELRKELQEEREKRARMEGAWTQIQERLKAPQTPAQQQQQSQIPEYDKDPLGHLQGTIAALHQEIASLKGHTQQQTQVSQQQAQYNAVMNRYAGDLAAMSRKTPDFTEAYNWLAQNVEAELEARGFVDPQIRQQIIRQEEETIIANAYQSNRNPAEIIYGLAKHRGYKGKQAAPVEENKLERLQKGQKAAASLSAAKGAGQANGADTMSLEMLAELMVSDPDEADKMWTKMAKRGLLG